MEETPMKVFMDSGLTTGEQVPKNVPVVNAVFLDTDGNPVRVGGGGGAEAVPKATTAKVGGILMANSIADPSGTTIGDLATIDGETVTVDNLNQVITQVNNMADLINEVLTTQKELLAKLRGCGVIDQSA